MRVYLDYNATTPLRAEARKAMADAMDVLGNPSSVHAEGRAAKALMETARFELAEASGASNAEIIFTASATEAAALALNGGEALGADVEHDCVAAHITPSLKVDQNGQIEAAENAVRQVANSETGVLQLETPPSLLADAVQAFGKVPYSFSWGNAKMALLSAHKIGGPKGIGALIVEKGHDLTPVIKGGGQEMGRRSGTENLIGIAGFAAAAKAAQNDINNGLWGEVSALRDHFEDILLNEVSEITIFGKSTKRLPNTSCFALSGWKGETQVMQMDLAGYAISAGSACSSGKLRSSRVLRAMGADDLLASSAIRISISPQTQRHEIEEFAQTWVAQYRRRTRSAA